MLPQVCNTLMTLNTNDNARYSIRVTYDFVTPVFRTYIREKGISIQGPMIWNTLPLEIKAASSISAFKILLSNYILSSY